MIIIVSSSIHILTIKYCRSHIKKLKNLLIFIHILPDSFCCFELFLYLTNPPPLPSYLWRLIPPGIHYQTSIWIICAFTHVSVFRWLNGFKEDFWDFFLYIFPCKIKHQHPSPLLLNTTLGTIFWINLKLHFLRILSHKI